MIGCVDRWVAYPWLVTDTPFTISSCSSTLATEGPVSSIISVFVHRRGERKKQGGCARTRVGMMSGSLPVSSIISVFVLRRGERKKQGGCARTRVGMSESLPDSSIISVFFSGQGAMVGFVALMMLTIVSSNNSHRPTLTPQFNMSLAAAAASRTEGNDTRIAYDTL